MTSSSCRVAIVGAVVLLCGLIVGHGTPDPASPPEPHDRLSVEGAVRSLAFSPNGAYLAVGLSGTWGELWDMRRGELLARLEGHRGEVRDVTFGPHGQRLATASHDGLARLWTVPGGQLIREFEGHDDFVRAVAISPDGQTLATGSKDKTVRLWDMRTARQQRVMNGHTDWLNDLAFSPDGRWLASGALENSYRNAVQLWAGDTGRHQVTIGGHPAHVWAVAFAPDGRTLASASSDGTVRTWRVPDGRPQRVLEGHTRFVRAVAFTPSGRIVSGDTAGNVRLWPTDGSQPDDRWAFGAEIQALAVAPDGQLAVATCREDGFYLCRQSEIWIGSLPALGSPLTMPLADFDADGDRRLSDAEFLDLLDAWIEGRVDGPGLRAGIDAWIAQSRIDAPR